ncbi:hypothetical protein ACHAAC_10420 [Aeromicrobium sp. CF4.19]|uniref:acyl-CoA thioesterase n=1 Tax=Aeromicrobium sp. CF4.19 TaxID=3373082 RepID=UPI003EE81844
MPIHHLPMRWADLDQLGHVNNVVYVDYAMEAVAELEQSGRLEPGPVAEASVEFRRPLLLSSAPVVVESAVEDDEVRLTIGSAGAGDTVFCLVVLRRGEPGVHNAPRSLDDEPYPLKVRRSDVAADGAATLTKLFEYSQEARIHRISRALSKLSPGRFVVGRVTVRPAAPMVWREEPYAVRTDIVRLGGASLTLRSSVEDGAHGEAEAVLVGFDQEKQTSRRLDADERAELLPHVVATD